MKLILDITVPGKATTQGSKVLQRAGRYFGAKHKCMPVCCICGGKMFMREHAGSRLKAWRKSIWAYARAGRDNTLDLVKPVELKIDVLFPKPDKPSRPYPCTSGGLDVSKLARAIEDALTDSGVWSDDSQVVHLDIWKRYAEPGETEGAHIQVRDLSPQTQLPGMGEET